MKLLLAILIGTLEFQKVEGFQVEKYSLITMRPKNGLYLHVRRVDSLKRARNSDAKEQDS